MLSWSFGMWRFGFVLKIVRLCYLKQTFFIFSASKNVRSFCGDAAMFIRKACINLVLLHVLLSVIIQKCDHFPTTAHNNNKNYSHFNGLLDVVVSTDLNHMNHMTLVFSQHAAITSQKPSLERTKKLSTIHPTSFQSPTSHRATRKQVPNFFLYSERPQILGWDLGAKPGQRPWAKAAKAVSTSAASSSWFSSLSSSSSLSCAGNRGTEANVAWKMARTTGNAIALPAMSVRKLCELQEGGKLRAFARYNKIGKPW